CRVRCVLRSQTRNVISRALMTNAGAAGLPVSNVLIDATPVTPAGAGALRSTKVVSVGLFAKPGYDRTTRTLNDTTSVINRLAARRFGAPPPPTVLALGAARLPGLVRSVGLLKKRVALRPSVGRQLTSS